MVRSKVEDMSQQHTEILAMAGAASKTDTAPNAMVAVVSGYGLVKVFRSYGARIVSGGQTQNPSVQDILDAARSVESDTVMVLPNNKNVLLAAQKAAEISEGKKLIVVPTRTMGQGLGAALAFNAEADAQTLATEMLEASTRVLTLEVTRASRTTVIDGRNISEGDVIGLRDDVLIYNGGTPEDAVLEMLKGSYAAQEIITIFTGPNVEPDTLEALTQRIQAQLPQCEVQSLPGGPDLYDYTVTFE
jgi:uncharacterized protein